MDMIPLLFYPSNLEPHNTKTQERRSGKVARREYKEGIGKQGQENTEEGRRTTKILQSRGRTRAARRAKEPLPRTEKLAVPILRNLPNAEGEIAARAGYGRRRSLCLFARAEEP
jgi:hypothetical protein